MIAIYIFHNNDNRSGDERLRLAAGDYSGQTGIFQVARTERGKPYFPQCPQIHFSISHSGSYWVCAFAREAIGVDLQEHVRLKNETVDAATIRFGKIAQRFFHPLEAKYVAANGYRDFFRVWTARESYVKYTGQGIDGSFSEHCVLPQKPLNCQAQESLSWQAQQVWFWSTQYQENYTLCVCTKERQECSIIHIR